MLDKLSALLSGLLPSYEKSRQSLVYRGEKCLNCEQPLDKSDRFCPHCSQENSTKKLLFSDFFTEFFANLIAYDSRLTRTLRILIFKPGRISKEYIEGKRMRYANPFRFYLSISILFFLLYAVISKIESYNLPSANIQNNSDAWITDPDSSATIHQLNTIKNNRESTRQQLEKLDSIVEANPTISAQIPKLADTITQPLPPNSDLKAREIISLFGTDSVQGYTHRELESMPEVKSLTTKFDIYWDYHNKNPETKPVAALNELKHPLTTKNLWMYKKVIDLDYFIKNPDFAFNFFISKLPFVIFLFIPVFALFIKLLYIRKHRFSYMEHLIFAFHIQSFFFVLLFFAVLLDFLLATSLFTIILLLIFGIYLYLAMRKFYAQGRFKTFVKFIILNSLFSVLALLTAIAYTFLSFSLY